MKWLCRSPGLSLVLLTATLCSLTQVECRIRRRRQYISNNYGAYAIDPPVASFYGTGGGGSYTGNSQNSNRFIVGGVAYQYPTPVNVMSGGSYNPREYNAWPSGADAYNYANMNNMRLPAADRLTWGYYMYGYPFLPLFNDAQRQTHVPLLVKLFLMFFTSLACISIL